MLAFDTGESNVVHKHSTGMLLSSPTVMLSGHTCTKVKVITLNLKTRQKQAPTTAPDQDPLGALQLGLFHNFLIQIPGLIAISQLLYFCLDLTVDWET